LALAVPLGAPAPNMWSRHKRAAPRVMKRVMLALGALPAHERHPRLTEVQPVCYEVVWPGAGTTNVYFVDGADAGKHKKLKHTN
jgi:hypothetical protein